MGNLFSSGKSKQQNVRTVPRARTPSQTWASDLTYHRHDPPMARPVLAQPTRPTRATMAVRASSVAPATRATNTVRKCGACGETDHFTDSCRYARRLCFHCRQEGHISRVCPNRRPARRDNSNTRPSRARSQSRM